MDLDGTISTKVVVLRFTSTGASTGNLQAVDNVYVGDIENPSYLVADEDSSQQNGDNESETEADIINESIDSSDTSNTNNDTIVENGTDTNNISEISIEENIVVNGTFGQPSLFTRNWRDWIYPGCR